MDLQRYKNETLSPEELEEYTQKLVRAKFDEDYRNKWRQKLLSEQEIQRSPSKELTENKSVNLFSYWKIAAAIILLLVIAIPSIIVLNRDVQYQVDTLIAADHFRNKEGGKKGSILSGELLREQAGLAFNNKDYHKANALYLQLIDKPDVQKSDYFFSAYCYLKLEEFDKSVEQFKAVQKIKTAPYREESNWYLSWALIKQEKLAEAKVLLAGIKKGEWRYEQAQELLKDF